MRVPVQMVRQAVQKKRKVVAEGEGPSKQPRSRSPPRSPVPAPLASRRLSTPEPSPPVDLDTPPEGQRAEVVRAPQEPTTSGARLTWGGDESAPVEARSAGERITEEGSAEAGPTTVGVAPESVEAPSTAAPPEVAEGSGAGVAAPRLSLLSDGRRAEQLMARTLQPDIMDELNHMGGSSFFRELAAAQLRVSILFTSLSYLSDLMLTATSMQVSHSVAVFKEVMTRSERALRQVQRELTEARTRALRAEGELKAVRAAQAKELEDVRCREVAERERVREVQGRLDTAEATISAREAAINAQNLRLDAFTLEVRAAAMRATQAEEASRRAEERASGAEGAARQAEERASKAEEAARQAEARATGAEAAARVAEARRASALADFRESRDFAAELAGACSDAYVYGFNDAKKKVERAFGLTGLDSIEPDGEGLEELETSAGASESAGDRAAPAADELAPAEDPSAVPDVVPEVVPGDEESAPAEI